MDLQHARFPCRSFYFPATLPPCSSSLLSLLYTAAGLGVARVCMELLLLVLLGITQLLLQPTTVSQQLQGALKNAVHKGVCAIRSGA